MSRLPIPTRILWLRIINSVLSALVAFFAAQHLFQTLDVPPAYQALGLYFLFCCQMYWATVAHIANDGLAVALSVWFFAAVAAFAKEPNRATALHLALAASLGLLAKAYFLPLTIYAACLIAWRHLRALPLFAMAVALIALPWYVRNLALYHNWSGLMMASAGITTLQALRSLVQVDWGRAIPYMLRATLWTGNSSLTNFSVVTLNYLLALLAAGAVMYAADALRRRPVSMGERAVLGAILVYAAAVVYVVGNDVIFLHGASAGAAPWYTQVLLVPLLVFVLLGMSRIQRPGRWVAGVTALLWMYISIATYVIKLIPLYGGFSKGRNTLMETLQWYGASYREITSVLSTISLAPPAIIYLETAAVTGLAVALAIRLVLRIIRSREFG
jgi:hypothetical protein